MQTGQRITLLRIDDGLALTQRYELKVCSICDGAPATWPGRGRRLAIVQQRGKKKSRYLDLGPDDILLDGWDLPMRADTECAGVFAGNGCFNLIGDPGAIRECLETKAVFPISDGAKAKVLVGRSARTTCDDSGLELLYPAIDTPHAVVNRFKEARL
jgi:hypothetical protein